MPFSKCATRICWLICILWLVSCIINSPASAGWNRRCAGEFSPRWLFSTAASDIFLMALQIKCQCTRRTVVAKRQRLGQYSNLPLHFFRPSNASPKKAENPQTIPDFQGFFVQLNYRKKKNPTFIVCYPHILWFYQSHFCHYWFHEICNFHWNHKCQTKKKEANKQTKKQTNNLIW